MSDTGSKKGCFAIAIILTILLALNYVVNKTECHLKADALGYKSNFAPLQGCVLEKPNGKKVLLEQLRDFE